MTTTKKIVKAKVYETNLRTREKKEVEIEVFAGRCYCLNPLDKMPGDIYLTNGVIRHVFKKVPDCLFYSHNKTRERTALSYS